MAEYQYDQLDLKGLPIEVDVPRIDEFKNEIYATLRKRGLGGSDSSVLVGVNPYKRKTDLIEEKSRDWLTEEEKAVGGKIAVKKGRDLEPVIIDKFSRVINKYIMKPTDMYRYKDCPYMKMNFDGVIDKEDGQYIPAEIKVVTKAGERHYKIHKAWYRESQGFAPLPISVADSNMSIEDKAAHYGIPPYYYTQLQDEMFALNAPFGYLTVLLDNSWELVSFYVPFDQTTINQVFLEGYKASQHIARNRDDSNWFDTAGLQREFSSQRGNKPTDDDVNVTKDEHGDEIHSYF